MLPLSYRLDLAGAVRRPPGFDSGWRSFGNTLITRISGGGHAIRSAAGTLPVADGLAFLIPPGLRHRVAVTAGRAVVATFTHLHCRVYELQGLFTVLDRPIVFAQADARRIGACNDALIGCQERGGLDASVEASARLAELVGIAVARCPDLAAAWNRPGRARLLPVLRHIQDHLDGPLDRTGLARAAGVSVPHLHTLFLRAFGIAPMELVRRERMQHARQLLQLTSLAVAEVGRRCGFADPYHFSRAFSRSEGVAPSRYRRDRLDGSA